LVTGGEEAGMAEIAMVFQLDIEAPGIAEGEHGRGRMKKYWAARLPWKCCIKAAAIPLADCDAKGRWDQSFRLRKRMPAFWAWPAKSKPVTPNTATTLAA